jgi:hypothetical protein
MFFTFNASKFIYGYLSFLWQGVTIVYFTMFLPFNGNHRFIVDFWNYDIVSITHTKFTHGLKKIT